MAIFVITKIRRPLFSPIALTRRRKKAAIFFKAKKEYEVTVMLAENSNGDPVKHSTASL
jgi:hypothetical protein